MRVGAAALCAVAALGACSSDASEALRAEVGKKAPTFETVDLDGNAVTLAEFDDDIVLLNFWASWCVPCRKEFPELAKMHARDGVTVLGVVFNDSDEDARRFMEERKATWPGLVDDGGIAGAYGVQERPGIPMTFVIDADGILRAKHIGEADGDDLSDMVREAS